MAKVLLVEDDPLISRMYLKTFAVEGFEVQLAENGQQGLEKLVDFHPDIILLDVMMPEMNGLQMLQAVKADPATKAIPVIMLTNLAEVNTVEDATMGGAVKYIVKSDYDPADVADIVRSVLGIKKDAAPQ